MTSIDRWWTLTPDPTLIVDGCGSGDRLNVAARSADRRWILAYLSEAGTSTLRLTDAIACDSYQVQAINPATGERSSLTARPAETRVTIAAPSGWEDALVLIEARP